MTAPAAVRSHALLTDGTTIEIRQVGPDDFGAVLRFHEAMSPGNLYLRFFSISKLAAEQEARRVSRPPGPDHAALLAELAGRVIGLASYEPATTPGVAEVAFAVADDMHGRGVATLLLEHLVSLGRGRHVQAFRAETLPENVAMLRVFAAAGLTVQRRLTGNVVELTMPIPRAAALDEASPYLDAVARRESLADVESLRPLLAPTSVVVVGASRRQRTVGRSILDNIVGGGYSGRVYAVNPHTPRLGTVPTLPSVAALPEAPDLAVVAVPPAQVPSVAESCGQRGARGIVVITSALSPEQGTRLLAACRRHSMRLVGPNCFGIAVPRLGLNATFAAAHPAVGSAGLVMQSGGLGFALLTHLSRIGVGVSSFVSAGNKYDVSGNDLLTWWERDGVTRLAVLYLESFGNPRKFARTAQRVGRTIPVLTVYAGRSEAGQRAAASHTAAAATPLISREALFQQTGVIATQTFGELLDAAAFLAAQPVPAGPRVAVVSSAGGAGVLAADACVAAGLTVHQPSRAVQRRLGEIIPRGGAVTGPVDTTAAMPPAGFRRCLELVAGDEGVDAVLALILPTAAGDLLPAVRAATLAVPAALVVLDQPEGVTLIPRTPPGEHTRRAPAGMLPAYAYPESAARALGHAVRYGRWRARPPARTSDLPGLRPGDARALVTGFLARLPGGGWLPAGEVDELLRCYGVPLVGGAAGMTGGAAGAAPAAAPGRPLVPGGIEVVAGAVQDPVFGPLVLFGLGGTAAGVAGARAARLAPLTGADADDLIRSVQAAPLLPGRRGAPAVDVAGLRDVLLRMSRLADDLPQVAELELNPVIARPGGVSALAAQVRVTCRELADPFLRQLRQLREPGPPGQAPTGQPVPLDRRAPDG